MPSTGLIGQAAGVGMVGLKGGFSGLNRGQGR